MIVRFLCSLCALLSLQSVSLYAQPNDPLEARAQVLAATQDATFQLVQQVGGQPLLDGHSVAQIVGPTYGTGCLAGALKDAVQIGAPRWINDHTCQVTLRISGTTAASAIQNTLLLQAHAAEYQTNPTSPQDSDCQTNPTATRKAPYQTNPTTARTNQYQTNPTRIQTALEGWDQKTFLATGTSIAAAAISQLPLPADAPAVWQQTDPQQRRMRVQMAHDNAVSLALQQIAAIPLTENTSIQQLFDSKGTPAKTAMAAYLQSRPVIAVNFKDDLIVQVTIADDPQSAFEAFRDVASTINAPQLPPDEEAWDELQTRFIKSVTPVTGFSRRADHQAPSAADAPTSLTLDQAPAWINDQLNATATAPNAGSKLHTSLTAERQARAKLAEQVKRLPLGTGQTIGSAAETYPAIHDAVERTLKRARIYKSDYHSDGSVEIKIALNLRDLWQALTQ